MASLVDDAGDLRSYVVALEVAVPADVDAEELSERLQATARSLGLKLTIAAVQEEVL
jgi:hypothetical protein